MKRFLLTSLSVATFLCTFTPSSIYAADLGGGPRINASDVVPGAVSEDMTYLLVSNPFANGLKLLNSQTGEVVEVSAQANAAQYASISADGKYVCYKAFDGSKQIPMLFDIAAKRAIALCPAAALAGTPAVSKDGKVAYTVANKLFILSPALGVIKTIDLGNYVNLLAFNGRKVAFNDANEQIVVVDVATGAKRTLTDGKASYWGPAFSPKGDKILVKSVEGKLLAGAVAGKALKQLDASCEGAAWVDNSSVAFVKKAVKNNAVVKTEVITSDFQGKAKAVALAEDGDAYVVAGKSLAVGKGKSLKYGYMKAGKAQLAAVAAPEVGFAAKDDAKVDVDEPVTKNKVDYGTYVRLDGVPYLHQLYDTPDYWNGNSSCGASSAMMAINYFNILPKHPITVSTPSSHTSNYGWYVPEIYTFNGHTYNIGETDPNGRMGYGAFGYITQNNWEETRGHMAELIGYHGPSSSADWSPTFAKSKTETDSNYPYVLLNSLTSAGHYITCIGYYKSQYTLIFNDPYGNKSSGSYPSASGTNVKYDWPGYNNGYSNLNTVHTFIYCRFGQPSAATNLTATAVSSSQINLTWTDNSYCEANYEVWRSTTAGSGYAKVATLGSNVTSYSNTGLAGNTRYYYVVKACNPSGCSANSNEANALTQAGVADIIVDNANAGFTASTNWSTGTSSTDKYGTNYRFRSTAALSDQAQFSFNIATARNYEIYAWWCVGSNRSTNTPYILPDATQVKVNQQANGGKWNTLGVKSLVTGTNNVKVSCWTTSGFVVIADAIKVVAR